MGKNQDPGTGINIPDPQHCFKKLRFLRFRFHNTDVKRSLYTVLYCTVPVDEVLSHGEDGLDAVRIGGQLGLECLVLLVLGLDIGRILDDTWRYHQFHPILAIFGSVPDTDFWNLHDSDPELFCTDLDSVSTSKKMNNNLDFCCLVTFL
jgi:hypothetical protein